MKWCLVAAGLKDLTRPADKLSVSQNIGASYFPYCLRYGYLNRPASPRWNGFHLGPLLARHYTREL